MATATKTRPSTRKTTSTRPTRKKDDTPLVLTGEALDKEIRRLNADRSLNYGDRIALFDRLLVAWPKTTLPDTYKVEEIILPGGVHRCIAVSGQTVAENMKMTPPKTEQNYFPLIDIFEVMSGSKIADARHVTLLRMSNVPEWMREVEKARHIEILGPCAVIHDPMQPVDGLKRRACVMQTSAPLRVYVDTWEQSRLNNGTGEQPRFGC